MSLVFRFPCCSSVAVLGIGVALFAIDPAQASLIGTDLTLSTLAQSTATSAPVTTSFPRTVTVADPGVEYPDVASLFNPGVTVPPGFASSLVNIAIDAGADFITLNFANSAPFTQFATGYQNTYVFTFNSAAAVGINGATVDTAVTTLGLTNSDLSFAGDQLFVNVENLTFNPSTFARIDLNVSGGPATTPSIPTPPNMPVVTPDMPVVTPNMPVPEPGTLGVLAVGLIGLGWTRGLRNKRTENL